jgi:hypothetical protein
MPKIPNRIRVRIFYWRPLERLLYHSVDGNSAEVLAFVSRKDVNMFIPRIIVAVLL